MTSWSSGKVSDTPRPPLVPDVPTEGPGRGELAELVAHHRLGHEDRHMLAAVVYGDGVAEHGWHDHRATGPGLDDVLGALVVLGVHLLHQVVVHEGALLQAARHRSVLLAPLGRFAATDDEAIAFLVGTAGAGFQPCPPAAA